MAAKAGKRSEGGGKIGRGRAAAERREVEPLLKSGRDADCLAGFAAADAAAAAAFSFVSGEAEESEPPPPSSSPLSGCWKCLNTRR